MYVALTKIFCLMGIAVASQSLNAATMLNNSASLEDQMVEHVKSFLSQKMNLESEHFDVRADNVIVFPPLEEDIKDVEIVGLMGLGASGYRLDGLFSVAASLKLNSEKIREYQLSGMLAINGPVWVARENLSRGKLISAPDIALVKLPWKTLSSGIASTTKEQLLGRSVRSYLGRGVPINVAFLEEAASVQPGDMVELTVQSGPGVFIRSRAIARQRGRVGDFIRVEQPETKKNMQVLITGDRRVEVQL